MKRTIATFLIVSLVVGLLSCSQKSQDQPDRTGSWGHINQEITRPTNWKQVVTNSPFKIGEIKKATSWSRPGVPEDYFIFNMGTFPRMDGSTVCVPMALEFTWQHLGLSDLDAISFVQFSTTNFAYRYLISKEKGRTPYIQSAKAFAEEGTVDIIFVTEPSDEELAFAEEHGVKLIVEPICYDSFVMITHKDNPVDSLTVEQIQKIYSGEITNWKQVGGTDAPIMPYQREKNSGSQTTMEKRVMQGKEMIEPNMLNVILGMGVLIKTVGEYKNSPESIGYTFKYYIDTLYKSDKIKVLKIDGIEPSNENMRNGIYPFTTNYFAVIREGDENSIGSKFLKWMLTDEGQRCIEQAGYCSLRNGK